MDVKSISIEVSAKGIAPAAKALDNLSKAAGTASPVVQELQKQLKSFSDASLGSVISQLSNAASSIQRLKNVTKDMSNTGQSFKGLSNATTNIASAMERLVASTNGLAGFNDQLAKTAATLASMKGDAGVLSTLGRTTTASGGSRTTSSGGSSTNETEALTKRQQALLRQIEYTTVFAEKGRAGMLEYRAAQLGVAQAAAPMIERLKATSNILGNTGVSAKQVAAATRMIPAQFTDIATQLAGGQNPMLILLQQGGQIKDMFQGDIPAALKATGGYVVKFLTNPYLIAAAALAATAYAAYKFATQNDELNKSLVLTNGYVGYSAAGAAQLSESLAAAAGSTGKAVDAFNAIAASGKITGDALDRMIAASARFASATGTDIAKVVSEYETLSEKPSDSILKLNEKYHFLTASVYAQIKALEDQGKTTEAVALAQDTLADSHTRMAIALEKNASAWTKLKNGFVSYYDAITNSVWGDKETKSLQAAESSLIAVIDQRDAALRNASANGMQVSKSVLAYYDQEIQKQRSIVEGIRGRRKEENQAASDKATKQKTEEETAAAIKAADSYDKLYSAKAKTKEIDKQISLIKASGSSEENTRRILALEKERQRVLDSAQEKTNTRDADALAGLDAEIRALKENIAGYQSKGSAYDSLTEKAKQLYTVEAKLGSGSYDAKTVAALEAQRGKLEEIVSLEKTQSDLKESAKREKSALDATKTLEGEIKAIQARNEALQNGETVSKTLTDAEKKLQVVQQQILEATTASESAALLDEAAKLRQKVAAEALGTALTKTRKIEEDNSKVKEQSAAQYDALIAKYKQEQDALNYSEAQLSKMTAVRQIEVDTAKKVAEAQAEINNLKRQENADNEGQIAALNERIYTLQTARDKMVDLINSQPDYKKLFGESDLKDMKNGFQNFYNSLSNSQQLYQQAFQQGYSLMGSTLSTFFKTGKFDAKEWAANMLGYIADVVAQLLVLKAVQAAVTSSQQSSQASWVGAAISAAAASAKGNAFSGGGVQKFAKGGAFTNQIFNQPTPFLFGSGGSFSLGVMGEEKSNRNGEAVMPLTRNSQGDLSVNATGVSGGGSIGVYVTVNSDGSSTSSTSGTNDAQLKQLGAALGDRMRQVIATEMRPGGLLASR